MSMEQKGHHTPGPWHVDPTEVWKKDGTADVDAYGWASLARVVVQMEDEDGLSEEGVANARLIAAAPDLLDAAKLADAMMSEWAAKVGPKHSWWDAIFDIRAVIAKARGVQS